MLKKRAFSWKTRKVVEALGIEKLHYYVPTTKNSEQRIIKKDVIIYGGTPAGITAAVQIACPMPCRSVARKFFGDFRLLEELFILPFS